MGIFNRFTKTESMNMKTGKFEPRKRSMKELTYEEQMDTPQNRRRARREQRRQERETLQKMEKEAYHKAYTKARVKRATQRGTYRGGTPWYERIQMPSYQPSTSYRTRKTTRKKKGKKRKTAQRRTSDFNFDFDPIDNWRF